MVQSEWRARNLRIAAMPCSGDRQIVEAEFEEAFAGVVFLARVGEQSFGVGESECDANARE